MRRSQKRRWRKGKQVESKKGSFSGGPQVSILNSKSKRHEPLPKTYTAKDYERARVRIIVQDGQIVDRKRYCEIFPPVSDHGPRPPRYECASSIDESPAAVLGEACEGDGEPRPVVQLTGRATRMEDALDQGDTT